MADPEQLAILTQGVEVWNEWRKTHRGVELNLHSANLAGFDLREANFSEVNMGRADLTGANLSKAKLNGSSLYFTLMGDADLSGADLRHANLFGALLTGADLSGSDLTHTDFGSADLSKADLSRAELNMAELRDVKLNNTQFSHASFGGTTIAETDLRGAKGLDTTFHSGPSCLGIETIYRSGGEISEVFLRGVGVPEVFITYMRSLTGSAIEFYSCFISHSTKDQEFAERLYADLQANNVRCWFAPHDMAGGKKIHEQIDEAIRLHDKLLLILSPDSMKSSWVETEIAKARKREVRDERRVLFPVRLVDFDTLKNWECFDADTGKDSAREIREFFIPDFSDWKNHDSYQKAFQRLLKDLKAE